jgi:hypothetical protein
MSLKDLQVNFTAFQLITDNIIQKIIILLPTLSKI